MKSVIKILMVGVCAFAYANLQAQVSTVVILRDSNEVLLPVDSNSSLQYTDYGQIMEGTELAIVVCSDNIEFDKYMGLYIADDDRNLAILAARGDEFMGYPQSIFDAAGISTSAIIYPVDGYIPDMDIDATGFDFMTGFDDVSTGDWFVFDYDTLEIGDCNTSLYQYEYPNASLLQELRFTHVPTRDFNADGQVNFGDFSLLATFFGTDCNDPESCHGVNLDDYSLVDINDLVLFTSFWLEKTK